jgi:1-acyl-sn-glycerol-3-phosphate acyltransferase
MATIRFFGAVLCIVASAVFFSLVIIVVSIFRKDGNWQHILARTWGRIVLAVSGVRVSVKGLQNLTADGSRIYISNHQSLFDIPVLMACLPVQYRWLAKAELFKIPIFGRAMQRTGYISIDRSNRKAAYKSLRSAAATIKRGTSVIIFPEGTRNHEAAIGPFKMGGFVLAVESGAPIVPMVLHGTRNIMPTKQLRISPGKVEVEILEAIPTAQYNRKNKAELMQRVHRAISKSFETGQSMVAPC